MLKSIFTVSYSNDSLTKTFSRGYFLTAMVVFFVPFIGLAGYYRCLIESDRDELPKFNDVFTTIRDGTLLGSAGSVWLFVPLFGYLAILRVFVAPATIAGSTSPVRLIAGVIFYAILFAVFYTLPAVVYIVSREDNLRSLLSIERLRTVISTPVYKYVFVGSIVVPLVLTFTTGYLVAVTVVFLPLLPAVGFYSLIVSGRCISVLRERVADTYPS